MPESAQDPVSRNKSHPSAAIDDQVFRELLEGLLQYQTHVRIRAMSNQEVRREVESVLEDMLYRGASVARGCASPK
jgi:hypothetical protein